MTLDAGALIAMDRHKLPAIRWLELAARRDVVLSTPVPVISEWWRGRSDWRSRILDVVQVDPLTLEVAKLAGEAVGAVRAATTLDAIVMAHAASTSGLVVTGDVHDLERLRAFFPNVKVLGLTSR